MARRQRTTAERSWRTATSRAPSANVRRTPAPRPSPAGAAALARGEGELAIHLVQDILNKPEIEVVAPLPVELGGHMDAVLAVSTRSPNPKAAMDFIKFLTSPQARTAWKAKGMLPF